MDVLLGGARRALCLGIGGGGDVVGALAVAQAARARGAQFVVGGMTWERLPIDPLPGPRRLDEIEGAERLNAAVALAGPDTRGPGGFRFAESRMAEILGEPVVLLDPNPGPRAVGDALADAALRLGCDLVVLVDVGGDVLAHGDEPGLGSPLCDAIVLASAERLTPPGSPVAGAVFGPCCDGELTLSPSSSSGSPRSPPRGGAAGGVGGHAGGARASRAAAAEIPTGGQRSGAGLRARRAGRRGDPRRPAKRRRARRWAP